VHTVLQSLVVALIHNPNMMEMVVWKVKFLNV
jgi:hypothetical protein